MKFFSGCPPPAATSPTSYLSKEIRLNNSSSASPTRITAQISRPCECFDCFPIEKVCKSSLRLGSLGQTAGNCKAQDALSLQIQRDTGRACLGRPDARPLRQDFAGRQTHRRNLGTQ